MIDRQIDYWLCYHLSREAITLLVNIKYEVQGQSTEESSKCYTEVCRALADLQVLHNRLTLLVTEEEEE